MQFRWVQDLFNLFFPHLCLACGEKQLHGDEILCFVCKRTLPETDMHLIAQNRFTDRFFGRVYLQTGAAIYLYKKDGHVQNLIHKLKYENKPQIGQKLGSYYGNVLKRTEIFSTIDLIIPVPLHPLKERKRGYNQSDQFAIGLSNTMYKPWLKDGLKRVKYGKSQTRKNREDRYENVLQSFEVNQTKALEGKHILLVDDVLTTGATLEACASKILAIRDTKISMATIAIGGL